MTDTRTLYIVSGSSGEYDGYHDWFVRGFFDPDKATDLRDALEVKARELGIYEDRPRSYDYSKAAADALRAAIAELATLDPKASAYETGVTYFIVECPVEMEAAALAPQGVPRE